jgi:hypothetical protein
MNISNATPQNGSENPTIVKKNVFHTRQINHATNMLVPNISAKTPIISNNVKNISILSL